MLCEHVDKLLDAYGEWNVSIIVAKSFWDLKNLSSLADHPVPSTLRSMQSFLGSFSYYSRFVEDFAIYASILYELREVDFFEASRQTKIRPDSDVLENDQDQRDKRTRATKAFVTLKDKIVNAPILAHFDLDKRPVVILYASKWAISAVLLRMLDVCYTQLVTRSIKVLTRHSTLAWRLNSSGIQGRLGRWAALLSNWTLEIVKCTKGEDEILGVIAASITPREEVDSILTSIAPRKHPKQVISMPPPTVEPDEELLVVSFDGSARVKRNGGAFSAIVWSLPNWTVILGASEYKTSLTVNEAEYHGLLLCFDLLAKQNVDRNLLIICGDSNLVIRQMRGEIECKAPGLKILRQKAMEKLRAWPNHEFLHVKRDWKQRADKLASAALQREAGEQVISKMEIDDLATLNRLDELLIPRSQIAVVKIAAITRSRQQHVRELTSTEAKIAEDYEMDDARLLFYCPPSKQSYEDRDLMTRLVIPETLQEDVFHHYHSCLEGGHQGIGRNEVIRHDRGPGFMSDFFRSFNKIVGQKQPATMAYRPQANGTAERMVKALTRSVKRYVSDINQRDWDEYAERLTFALNTAQDRVREIRLFYLIHEWDPRTTLDDSRRIDTPSRSRATSLAIPSPAALSARKRNG
ncbi:unnamed protein product [Phytophthora fragariaefolia]|uniref:Unnamed protein product n=1 Tax=Phytophthora fragariaefolia TaxID=1490495 RepID=A0A9W6YAP9_9STRA|nr:unnamed protein product [Phytophthora fragariaefolia]